MVKSLGKIEAQDASPLDVPGRPLAGILADTSKSWDEQIGTPADDPSPDAPAGFRRFGMPPPPMRDKLRRRLDAPSADDEAGKRPAPTPPQRPDAIAPPGQSPGHASAPLPPRPETTEPDPKRPSTPDDVTAAEEPPAAKAEEKSARLPPRMRKKLAQEAKAKAEDEVAKAPAAVPAPAAPAPAAPAPAAPAPAAAAAPAGLAPMPAAAPLPQAPDGAAPAALLPPPPREPRPYQRHYGDDGGPPEGPPPPSRAGAFGASQPSREDAVRAALASLRETTDLANCLMPLLDALIWRGDPRHVAEALPHFINNIDITSFRNILATLHFESRPIDLRIKDLDPRLMPCLFLPEDGDALVLVGRQVETIRIFDGGKNDFGEIPVSGLKGTAYIFQAVETEDLLSAQQKVGWFRAVTERFRSLFYQTLGITLILNLLALATPLFVMAVYDKVVATGSIPTLAYFAVGVGIAIACDMILRSVRARILAFIGARLDNIVGLAIFHKILFLPPALTERATVGAQVARIKDFESIRDFFTGAMATMLLEVPFAFIFFAVIIYLAGPLVWVPVIMVALYAILGLIFTPLIRANVSRAARASSRRQELVVESLNNMRAVKYCGAEANWLERYRDLSAKSALNGFYTSQLSSVVATASHILMVASGIGTIVFGVFRVLNGDMTVGSLVATMMLVWRILGPLQGAFMSMSRITQVRSSIGQINNLMNIKAERDQHSIVNPLKRFEGFLSFARVSIRYSPEADPALVGVSFEAEPGDVVCIVGGNGSGKSTALKLMAGMYTAQAGSIRIDNQDIRQMDPVELRHAVSYVPQSQEFFYGTIAQNMRLAHPTATEDDMHWACEKAGVLEDVLALEQGSGKWQRQGFEVRIGDTGVGSMPTSLLQRLNLARGYLKRAPIMLFDEPGNGLDFEGDQQFMRYVDELRGESTVLIVTHRPSHLRMADKIMWLDYGNVRAYGPAEEVLGQMPKDFL